MKKFVNSEEYFEKFSSELMTYVTYYHEYIIRKILEKEMYIIEPERFYFTLVSKVDYSLDVACLLIRNFSNKPYYQSSLIILLRSMLSDIITGEYVYITSKDEAQVKDTINSIYLDHVSRTYRAISGIYARLSEWSEEKVKKEKERFISSNQKYFDKNQKLIGNPLDISPEKAINKLFAKKGKGEDYEFLRLLYEHYDLFSKYEHFGELTFRLVHKPYLEKSIRAQFIPVFESVGIVVSALNNYCNVWDDLFTEEKEHLKILTERIFQYSLDLLPE